MTLPINTLFMFALKEVPMAGPNELRQIQAAISQANAGWRSDDNPVFRLSPAEQRLRLGVVPPPGARTIDQIARASPPPQSRAASLPAKFDLRDVGGSSFTTPPRDQLSCGSCVAFGTLGAIEGAISFSKKTPNPTIDLSEAHLFYCFGQPDGASCGTGWWPEKALPFCVSNGIVDEQCFKYTPGDQPCNLCPDSAKRLTRIRGFTRLNNDPNGMKQAISSKGAIIGCFAVFDDFFAYSGGIYKRVSNTQVGGHCITMVGYDDPSGCWICKNSWTTAWGEQGFFRIAYGECGIESWDVCTVDV
jgi:C1A family cysteine protease